MLQIIIEEIYLDNETDHILLSFEKIENINNMIFETQTKLVLFVDICLN